MKYILKEGQPVQCDNLIEWATWFGEADRQVAKDEIDDVRVSTVFLGLDHGFGLSGPPLLFETMIFGGAHDQYCELYATKEEALAGHATAVALVTSPAA